MNRKRKDAVKSAVKQIKKMAANGQAGDAEKTKETISKVYKALDKAAKKGTIKKNTASRKKSRLTKLLYKSSTLKQSA